MGSAKPITTGAARLLAAASSPRRARSRVAPLSVTVLPTGLVEDALMLANAISFARSESDGGARDELLCFVHSQSPSPLGLPDTSSLPLLFHPPSSHTSEKPAAIMELLGRSVHL